VIYPQSVLIHATAGNTLPGNLLYLIPGFSLFCSLELRKSPRSPRTGRTGIVFLVVAEKGKKAGNKCGETRTSVFAKACPRVSGPFRANSRNAHGLFEGSGSGASRKGTKKAPGQRNREILGFFRYFAVLQVLSRAPPQLLVVTARPGQSSGVGSRARRGGSLAARQFRSVKPVRCPAGWARLLKGFPAAVLSCAGSRHGLPS